MGTVYDCFLLPADGEIARLLLGEGKRYHDAVEALGGSQPAIPHPFGPPFAHLARALVTHLFEQVARLQPAHPQVVQELHHKVRLEDGSAELCADVVGCRPRKAYKSQVRRLLMATTTGAICRMFRKALQILGATLRIGQAPPGGLERAIQRAIDSHSDGGDHEPMLK